MGNDNEEQKNKGSENTGKTSYDSKKDKESGKSTEKIAFCALPGIILLALVSAGFVWADDILFVWTRNLAEYDTEYICTIISFAVILLTVIICFTVFSVKLNRHILRSNKLDSLRETYDKLSENLHSVNFTDKTLKETTTDVSGNTKTTEEYYPSGKAAVDLYKAYSSAVVDV